MKESTTSRRTRAYNLLAAFCFAVSISIISMLGWKLFVQDTVIASQQVAAAADFNASLPEPASMLAEPAPASAPTITPNGHSEPPTVKAPGAGEDFATLYVPRFGKDYVRVLREGTDVETVLNEGRIGHYENTAMPGAVGNFAIAAHRSAYGGGFHLLPDLEPGDAIYVRTAQGWFTYAYTEQRVVEPSEVSVLAPVPGVPGAAPTARMLTMTTCDPLYSSESRIAAFAEFASWQPLAAGAPTGVPVDALRAS